MNKFFTEKYNNQFRFINYSGQINAVLETGRTSILEIGIGNKLVSNYLKSVGLNVTTVDIDESLKPDVVVDMRDVNLSFTDNSFELILVAEVLEHIPFCDFEIVLSKLWKITSRNIVISLPCSCLSISIGLYAGLKRRYLVFSIPTFWISTSSEKKIGEHYWEIGLKGYSFKKIKNMIARYFLIKETIRIKEDPYHIILTLIKK